MIRRFKLFLFALLVAGSLAGVVAAPFAGATGVLDAACRQHGGAGSSSAVCSDNTAKNKNNNPLTGDGGLLSKISNIIAVFAGVAAVIIIMIAGFRMVTSSGNADNIAGARRAIIYASVGLIVIVLARFLVGLAISAT